MDGKAKLKNLLAVSTMILNDCDSFLWMRMSSVKKPKKLGAGNWLQIAGLISIVNFFAKINWIIEKNDWRDESSGKRMTLGIAEGESFELFIKQSSEIVDWGFKNMEAKEVWNKFRNVLLHLALFPYGHGASVLDKKLNHNYRSAKRAIREKGKALKSLSEESEAISRSFGKGQNGWECNGDILVEDLRSVEEWLTKKIDKTSDGKVSIILETLRKRLNT